MKFSNRFRITWWLLLALILAALLYYRLDAFIAGSTTTTDIFILAIFTAIMLVPIFSEIEFSGMKLKQEIEQLKEEVKVKLGDFKNQIESKQYQTVSTTIHGYPQPASDERLDKLQADIQHLMDARQSEVDVSSKRTESSLEIPKLTEEAFKVRYLLEKQLTRIWETSGLLVPENAHRDFAPRRVIQLLEKSQIIDSNLGYVLLQLMAICNASIHGQSLTDTQREFLEANWRKIFEYLKAI